MRSQDPLPALDILALDEALTRLRDKDERMASAVELRYFAGLSMAATARALGVTTRTVQRDWRYALAWLFQTMSADRDGADD